MPNLVKIVRFFLLKKFYIIPLFASIILYSVFTLDSPLLPGLYFDEAMVGLATKTILNNNEGLAKVTIKIFGQNFPVLWQKYHAALGSYLILPFLIIGKHFNCLALSYRLSTIFYGFITLLFFYLTLKELGINKIIISLVILLLSTHPTFLLIIRKGHYYNSLTLLSAILSFFYFIKWLKYKKRLFLYLEFFFLGTGISLFATFIYFIAALFVTHIILIKKYIKLNYRHVLYALFYFCLGGFLFIFGFLLNNQEIIKTLRFGFTNTEFNYNNLSYFKNLKERIVNLKLLIVGHGLILRESAKPLYIHHKYKRVHDYFKKFKHKANKYFFALFLLSFAFLSIYLLFKPNLFGLSSLSIFLFYMLFSPFSLSNAEILHITTIFPFIFIIIALVFQTLTENKLKYLLLSLFLFISLLVSLKNIYITESYLSFIKKTGGTELFSDSIYNLCNWLEKQKIETVIVCDNQLHPAIQFLTDKNSYVYVPNMPELARNLVFHIIHKFLITGTITGKTLFFIFIDDSPNISAMNDMLSEYNCKLTLIKTFKTRTGEILFKVYKNIYFK